MAVHRIVANIATPDPGKAHAFYEGLLGLKIVMDHGWIVTFADDGQAAPQVSFASEGGSGTPVPDLSIEVDDVDGVYASAVAAGFEITYAITNEPWGVRRFFVRDPFGKIVNILSHRPSRSA
jgi:catechol 2,3-dioxygenase-like lactoylglutathione lyase family enzyme